MPTEKPESKLILPPGAPIPDFDFGDGDGARGRFFIISGDQEPKIVVKDSEEDALAWQSQSLGAVTINNDMLLVVRGQASICCK